MAVESDRCVRCEVERTHDLVSRKEGCLADLLAGERVVDRELRVAARLVSADQTREGISGGGDGGHAAPRTSAWTSAFVAPASSSARASFPGGWESRMGTAC